MSGFQVNIWLSTNCSGIQIMLWLTQTTEIQALSRYSGVIFEELQSVWILAIIFVIFSCINKISIILLKYLKRMFEMSGNYLDCGPNSELFSETKGLSSEWDLVCWTALRPFVHLRFLPYVPQFEGTWWNNQAEAKQIWVSSVQTDL